MPGGVVTTHTLFCLRTPLPLSRQHFLCGVFNLYVLNAVVRLLMGGHVTTSLSRLARAGVAEHRARAAHRAAGARLARTRGAVPTDRRGAPGARRAACTHWTSRRSVQVLEGFRSCRGAERDAALARISARTG